MAERTRQQPPADDAAEKKSAYPLYGLKRSLEVAKVVADLGGANHPVEKSLIAQRMSVDEGSAALNQSIGSTKTFGLISGRGSYRLTEIGTRFFFPENPAEQRFALLAALKSPTIFEALINRFDGSKVPPSDALANILTRGHDVTESWRPRVASLFLSSLKEASVIDDSGFLRYKASLHSAESGTIASMDNVVPQMPPDAPQAAANHVNHAPAHRSESHAAPPSGDPARTTWSHQGLRVETPNPLPAGLWQTLMDYVNVLKPKGESQGN